MKSPEKYEKDAIDAYLKETGAYIVKPATGGYGASGTSDRIICYRGHFAAIEVKRPGKKPTALQEKRLKEVVAAGGAGFWGTAAKVVPELREWIRELENE